MDRYEIKKRATILLYTVKPRPFIVTVLLLAFLEAINMVSMQIGGQPFVFDPAAAKIGDLENMIRYVPENVTLLSSLCLGALQLLGMTLQTGYQSYCLHAARLQKCSFFDLMDGFLVFFKSLLIRLYIFITVYIASLLLLVPGLIVYYTYSMSIRLLLDHPGWSVVRCLRESRRLMSGYKKEFFSLRLSLIFWTVMTIFPITAIFARPYINLSETEFYLFRTGSNVSSDCFNEDEEEEENKDDDDDKNDKPPWEY